MNQKTRKALSFLLMVGTLAATAAVNYTILHSPIVMIGLFVLFMHEIGHYIAAKYYDVDFMYPFFIPIPLFSIGVTLTNQSTAEQTRVISVAGPLLASLVTLVIIFINIYYNFVPNIYLIILLFMEIIFNYFGPDGKRYRSTLIKQKSEPHQYIEASSSKESLWKEIMRYPVRMIENLKFV